LQWHLVLSQPTAFGGLLALSEHSGSDATPEYEGDDVSLKVLIHAAEALRLYL